MRGRAAPAVLPAHSGGPGPPGWRAAALRSGTIAFLLGILALCQLPELPPSPGTLLALWPVPGACAGLAITVLALAGAWRPRPGAPCLLCLRLLLCLAAGMLWAGWRAGLALEGALPAELEGQSVLVTGVVVGLPQRVPGREGGGHAGLRFQFRADSMQLARRAFEAPGRLLLNWSSAPPALRPGERWQLAVRLKRPAGFANGAGFDRERWLFRSGVRATGYVVPGHFSRRLAPARGHWVQRMRQSLRERIEAELGGLPGGAIVTALAMGARDGIGPAQWHVLNRTGTTHLVSISGLHITLVAGAAFYLSRMLWSALPGGPRRLAAPRAAALGSVAAAGGYAALAGFSVPTQRALIMLAVAVGAFWFARRLAPSRLLAAALAAVLLAQPFSVLGTGLWLSFGAVAGIVYISAWRRGRAGRGRELLHVHLAAALIMSPMLLFFFSSTPLLAPLANLAAVPWVSFVVTPLALAGAALSLCGLESGGLLLHMACRAVELLWPMLQWLAALPGGQFSRPGPPWWALLAGCLGVALLLAPRGVPRRWLGAMWMLPLLAQSPPRPEPGAFRFTLLDVGQGLSAVVETHAHVLVFDTGPRYGPRMDAGGAVIAPWLRSRGWRAVDLVLVSHGDSDHAGGLQGLRESLSVGRTLAPPEALAALAPAAPCRDGRRWRWDGVEFRLFRARGEGRSDNDGSCVLRVGSGESAVLVTGDIERGAERDLVARHGAALRAGTLVVPHHGSASSSTPAFLDAVAPSLGMVAAGYRNRFGFPDPAVRARYLQRGVALWTTGEGGALTLQGGDHTPRRVEAHRAAHRRFWTRR